MSSGNLYLSQPPFGPAIQGRGLTVVRQVLSKNNADGWSGKDISTRWTYAIRAWDAADPASAFIINELIAASATDAATGWLDDYVALGDAAHESALEWELVEIDGDNSDTDTTSNNREVVLVRWRQSIEPAPTA